MILPFFLLLTSLLEVQSLRRVSIGFDSIAPTIVSHDEFLPYNAISHISREEVPLRRVQIFREELTTIFPTPGDVIMSTTQQTPANIEFKVTPVNAKKKKLKKIKVKPRGGRKLKNTYQNLKPFSQQQEEENLMTTTELITLEPIYDASATTSYSQEELKQMCEHTKHVGHTFGIRKISTFAGENCSLIRLYYPDVTCDEIKIFVKYCEKTGLL